MNAPTATRADDQGVSAPSEATAAAARSGLDLSDYAEGVAGDAWALMTQLFFVHGKPRFPALAMEHDLSPPQALILRLLAEPQPMGALAVHMHCDNSNVTGIVDRLEERGLVERRPDPSDRRVKLIAATDAGAELREQLNRALAQPPEPLLKLSEEDQRRLLEILERAFAE
jgi:DNA-binding MarR family transcriptional regulator